MTNFSVLISVYFKENSSFFEKALSSIWDDQTLQPTEIVVVKDGELTPELDSVLIDYSKKAPVKVVALSTNVGLGKALAIGLDACSYELVARMDSDDVAVATRFEKQISYLIENPTDMVVTSLSVFCLTAAAGHNVRMCLYNVSGNVPTTPISGTDTGNLSCATTGQKEGTITATTLLAQNRYMVALQASSTAIGLRTEAQPQNDILFTDLIYYSVIFQTSGHIFGTFLSNPTIAAGLNGNSLKNANIFLKIQ